MITPYGHDIDEFSIEFELVESRLKLRMHLLVISWPSFPYAARKVLRLIASSCSNLATHTYLCHLPDAIEHFTLSCCWIRDSEPTAGARLSRLGPSGSSRGSWRRPHLCTESTRKFGG